jgi:hypothetical protein
MAAGDMAAGKASVLYTFYPPMIASPFYTLACAGRGGLVDLGRPDVHQSAGMEEEAILTRPCR